MVNKFAKQYNLLGLDAPKADIDPREKSDLISHAACKRLGFDPLAIPHVHHLPEQFRVFPVASYKLEVIAKAILQGRTADYDNPDREKWGPCFWMNKPGFRFFDAFYVDVASLVTGGPRLSLLSEADTEFFAEECIFYWADFCGGKLPEK